MTTMSARPSFHRLAAMSGVIVLALSVVGCNGGSDSSSSDDTAAEADPPRSVTVPPQRQTPFCEAMIELNERLSVDPPDDVNAVIVSAYEDTLADVPPEILDVFRAVLADLRAGSPSGPATSAPVESSGASETTAVFEIGEGVAPSDNPAEQLNDYVEFNCSDSVNNPGPPATAPLEETESS